MTTLKLKCNRVIDLNASFFFNEGGEYKFDFDDVTGNGFKDQWAIRGMLTTNLGHTVVAQLGRYTGKEIWYKDRNENILAYFEEV